MNYSIKKFIVLVKQNFIGYFKKTTAETLNWMATVTLHFSTVPSMLAYMSGIADKPPNVDLVLFIYASLGLLFGKAIISKDYLNIITVGIGFMCQAVLMAFILFR
jgi:hypothetical protein